MNTKLIAPEEMSALAPGFAAAEVALACYESDTGVADPIHTTYRFAKRAKELGVSIRES